MNIEKARRLVELDDHRKRIDAALKWYLSCKPHDFMGVIGANLRSDVLTAAGKTQIEMNSCISGFIIQMLEERREVIIAELEKTDEKK